MKKTYFLSDAHLGSLIFKDPREQELKLVRFLDSIKEDAQEIILLGDMFDFWFEYKSVVPKGHVRFLGKLAELVDKGIKIHFFIGNHDIWTFGYLESEIGLTIHKKPTTLELNGKSFFLAHGDGLNDDSKGFKFIRSIFHNKILQWLFARIPTNWGLAFGFNWSKNNRKKDQEYLNEYMGEDKEHLIRFAKKHSQDNQIDYYIFGHRHIMFDLQLPQKNRVLIIGDWINHFSYAVWNGKELSLEQEKT